jgi:hypothetical protein
MTTPLDTVLGYAAKGWQVFPLQVRAKEPLHRSRGFHDATSNPARLQRWFGRYPYNVGIRTGTASGVFVLDVDGKDGVDALQNLEDQHGPLPETLTSLTRRGKHYWFQLDRPLPSSLSRVGPQLDIKADGGYVAAPFSVHPSGTVYEWVDATLSTASAPEWLVHLAAKPTAASGRPPPPGGGGRPGDAYGQAVLFRELQHLRGTLKGGRNHALNRVGFRLFQLSAGGELHEHTVEVELLRACHDNGLIADDGLRSVQATIRSARAGLQYPRSRGGSS